MWYLYYKLWMTFTYHANIKFYICLELFVLYSALIYPYNYYFLYIMSPITLTMTKKQINNTFDKSSECKREQTACNMLPPELLFCCMFLFACIVRQL